MMRIFVSNNVVLFILVVTTAIDASRIFYLPLPKLHSSHENIPTSNAKEEPIKKPISDEFIPSSAIEREEIESNIYFHSEILFLKKSVKKTKYYFFFFSF